MNSDTSTPSHIEMIGEELKAAEQMAPREEVSKGHRTILQELLSQIEPINFRERAGLDDKEKNSRKHYIVISIDEVIKTAKANNWGLCTKDGYIYVYNGKYWQVVNEADFKTFLGKAALKMKVPFFDAKYHLFKDELFKQFLAEGNLPSPEPGDGVLINLQNGTFEIANDRQTLREYRRKDFLKYMLSFKYDPEAACPLFDTYLNRVLPDTDCQKVLAEYLGYIFIHNLKLEKALILYGSGANGKSVMFDIVNAIIGQENISSYSLENLTKYDSYQRAELSTKLINYASEINGKLEASIFKQLVSGEPVEARQIYGKPFVMRDYAKLMFNCNELPQEVEQTDAFFRRFIIIPFKETIPEEEQDPELAQKIIKDELSGVFNWILAGLKRLIAQKKFTASEEARQLLESYKLESDSVYRFIQEEGYEKSTNQTILLKKFYAEYNAYCHKNGCYPCSARKTSDRLKRLGFKMDRKSDGMAIYLKK